MTATATPTAAPAGTGSLTTSTVSLGRRVRNGVALTLMSLALLVVLVPLGFVVYSLIKKGGGLFNLSFLTKPIPTPRTIGPGMAPAVVGTLVITFWATAIAVPLGIMGAIYVVEYGRANRLSKLVRFLSDVMAGVPSIVMGLFIFSAFTLRFKQMGIGGSLALACLMLPIIIRSTESILRLVPQDMREASAALGSSRARTILTVVLPAALAGIVSGVLLAVARAAGETAPLLFTIGIVMARPNWNAFGGSNTTLSAQIFSLASSSSFVGSQQRAWTAALTLIVLVLVLTVVARLVTSRLAVRTS